MHVSGTDEDAIVKIVADHTNKQRQEIKAVYKTMFGRVSVTLNLTPLPSLYCWHWFIIIINVLF